MKKSRIFVAWFMLLVLICGITKPLIESSESVAQKVFRLHITANSDSAYDQSLKLKVRDYLLIETQDLFTADNIDDNINIAKNNINYIKGICINCLRENGSSSDVKVDVEKEFFDTRVYDDFTLPAGVYNSLHITIGEGEGHNWWCIIFPQVCLSACSKSMSEYLSDEEMELVDAGYTPKFKIVEIYEKAKSKIKNK